MLLIFSGPSKTCSSVHSTDGTQICGGGVVGGSGSVNSFRVFSIITCDTQGNILFPGIQTSYMDAYYHFFYPSTKLIWNLENNGKTGDSLDVQDKLMDIL